MTDERLDRIEEKLDRVLALVDEFLPAIRTLMSSGPWKWAMRGKGKTNV